jgi:hypothetical protein
MKITPITYKRAQEILNAKYSTIAAAARNGVFTKLPVTGLEQQLIQEQVELFIGKKQLKLAALSREEGKRWGEIEEEVNSTPQKKTSGVHVSREVTAALSLQLFEKAVRGELTLTRTPLEENLSPFVGKGSLSHLATLLEMLEVAAKNHEEELIVETVERILTPLHNAPSQIFFEVLFHVVAILQQHKCLQEMTAIIRELLSAA